MGSEHKLIFDGKLVDVDKPLVPAESRGLMYGDGCFETLRSYSGSFLHLGDHLRRFKQGASFLGLPFPAFFREAGLKSNLLSLLHENQLSQDEAVIRFQLWRAGGRGYDPADLKGLHFTVTAAGLPAIKESMSLAFVDTRRIPTAALPSQFKLSNNINYIAAARGAKEKGADDALMQTVDGYLSETTIANLFWTKDGSIYTPSEDCDLLPGITRNIMLKLAASKVVEGRFRPEDILQAEAAWICNSVREVVPISEIEGKALELHHRVLKRIKEEFARYKDQMLS